MGAFSLEYFARYVDPYYASVAWRSLGSTLTLGLLTATGGTILGFIFAYTMVRCNPPGKQWVHILALVPTVSPPFAIAMSTILLFGRNGLITRRFLGMEFPLGSNDIYGLDGLVFVQVLTFFSVAYLIIRAMLERLHPSMEEAAHSLGASKFYIFRTITLPLLIPGLAGSFLLLFVESLADLGNPLLISGNVNVLAAQIFLAVAGEFDYQKASTLALCAAAANAGCFYFAALLGQPPLVYFGDGQTGQRPHSGQRADHALVVYHSHLRYDGVDRGDVCLDPGRFV